MSSKLLLILQVSCLACLILNGGSAKSESVVMGAIGDYGIGRSAPLLASQVANLVKSFRPDFIITLGDNNYESGEAATIDINIGQFYHEYIHPYLGSYGSGAVTNRFFPSLGNHDLGPTRDFKAYLDYFTLPGNERYYNYRHGPVELFVLEDIGLGFGTNFVEQGAWLQTALEDSTAPWKIVYFHEPPYSSGLYGSPGPRWPFKEWGASVVLSGHDHNYQRNHTNGFVYFVNGLAGKIYPLQTNPGPSVVRYNGDFGAMRIAATETNLVFHFITRSNLVIDTYVMGDPIWSPTILMHPRDKTVSEGSDAQLLVEAIGSEQLGYQWQYNGQPIVGATNALMTISNVRSSHVGEYSVVVSDGTESVTSPPAELKVVPVTVWGCCGGLVEDLTNIVATSISRAWVGDFTAPQTPVVGLALTEPGAVVGWNANPGGTVPVPGGLTNIVAVSRGNTEFLALTDEGSVYAWAYNGRTPTNVSVRLDGIVAIASGPDFHLALREDGRVLAWGNNTYGQTNVPPDLTNAVAIAAGERHCLALKADGSVAAWGHNRSGEINVPMGLTNAIAIAAGGLPLTHFGGGSYSVALRRDGTLVGWGVHRVPSELTEVLAVSAGGTRGGAITREGRVVLWGMNFTNLFNLPSHLTNVTVRSLSVGFSYVAAVTSGGPPSDSPELVLPSATNDGFEVSVQTRRGSSYYLEWTDTLDTENWIMSQPAPGNGQTRVLRDSAPVSNQRFYRVRVQN